MIEDIRTGTPAGAEAGTMGECCLLACSWAHGCLLFFFKYNPGPSAFGALPMIISLALLHKLASEKMPHRHAHRPSLWKQFNWGSLFLGFWNWQPKLVTVILEALQVFYCFVCIQNSELHHVCTYMSLSLLTSSHYLLSSSHFQLAPNSCPFKSTWSVLSRCSNPDTLETTPSFMEDVVWRLWYS